MTPFIRKPIRLRPKNPRTVSTQDKVDFLGSPAAYPDHPRRVDVIETHMSWVFLTGDAVYKLKKPVKSSVLDFSTLAAREANCRKELSLNRRLAPETYTGIVRMTLTPDAALALNGAGRVIDWLVKMRRLPAERMLDRLIEHGTLSRTDIERVADRLAGFYRRADVADISPEDYVARFAREQAENASVLTASRFGLPRETVRAALKAVDDVLTREPQLLGDRARQGRVVEGHGDLRPEHICLVDPPVVIDCLEFNRNLRLVDPFDELVLLGLECERLGAAWIGELAVERCSGALDDRPPDRLIAFYTAFRAMLRARLVLSHLNDPAPREPEKWVPLARQYITIAEKAGLRMAPRAIRRSIPPRGCA